MFNRATVFAALAFAFIVGFRLGRGSDEGRANLAASQGRAYVQLPQRDEVYNEEASRSPHVVPRESAGGTGAVTLTFSSLPAAAASTTPSQTSTTSASSTSTSTATATAHPAAASVEALAALRALLAAELSRVSSRFSAASLATVLVHGGGAAGALGSRLTAAALSNAPFVVGVTGGSSTAGRSSWPAMLQRWLRGAVNVTGAVVRNAGQGTTSQLVTAPCIRALVGDGVDLLLWEFAMNDEYEYVTYDRAPDFPMRRRVAEAYIRQAAQLDPGAIGFVNLWDLDIHGYAGGPGLPNKAFGPTVAVAANYAPVYDRYFALDVMGAMWANQMYSDKSQFLRDPHHPNEFGYGVAMDLLSLAILAPWLAYLDGGAAAVAAAAAADVARAGGAVATRVRSHPLTTPIRDNLLLPGQKTLAHCYMAMPPQFSSVVNSTLRPVYEGVVASACASAATDPRDCDPTINVGRADADRDDRQLRFTPSACAAGGGAGGMLFVARVRALAAVLLDCGYSEGDHCLVALDVYLDGALVAPNTSVADDILSAFYKWVYKAPLHAAPAAAVTAVPAAETFNLKLTSHVIRVCARSEGAHFSRIVVLEQL